jgi:pyrroline-5-carboxylate reductase
MRQLGFIGTGTITAHLVRGLKASALADWPVLLSPRGAAVARALSDLPRVTVGASNQDVLDRADIVVLAVRPQVAQAVLRPLRFRPDMPVISLVAALSVTTLRDWTGAAQICRAIPLPFVERRSGVTPVFPPLAAAMALFDAVGQALPIDQAQEFDIYATASALMGTYFGLVDTARGWMTDQGISDADATTYLRALFADLGRSLAASDQPPAALRLAHSTPGGLNAQLHEVFAGQGGSAAVAAGLAAVLARIRAGTDQGRRDGRGDT